MKAKRLVLAAVFSCLLSLGAPVAMEPANADTVVSNRTRGATTDRNPLVGWEGYCTWGAQELIHANAGYYVQALTGNAELWANLARSGGWTVVSEAQPRSVAVFSSALVGGVGHVAWVDSVDGGVLTISEMNYGYGATPANGYRTTGFGEFDTRTIPELPGMSYILIP